jgi:hypothetical protein
MKHQDVWDLERRVRTLERRNGLLMALVGVLCAGALLAARAPAQVPDELRARRIQLVDGEGRVRIDLRHDDEETGMFILDDDGDTRLGAAQFAHGGGGYALHGPGGRGAAVLYLRGDGSLTMYDTDGAVTARFPEAQR